MNGVHMRKRKLLYRRKTYVREKKIYCGGHYMETDLYNITSNQLNKSGKRSKKTKESKIAQKNLNDKNSKRKLIQLLETNFTSEDIHLSLTYNDKYLPTSEYEAERKIKNFINRVKRLRKKEGLPDLKYILITSFTTEGEEREQEHISRVHHHLIINGGIERDKLEKLWCRRKKKGEAEGEALGFANSKRLQVDPNTGLNALGEYLAKHKKHKRKYSGSLNLKQPESRTNDHKFSQRDLQRFATGNFTIEEIEALYPGYTILDKDNGVSVEYNEMSGWRISFRLRRKDKKLAQDELHVR